LRRAFLYSVAIIAGYLMVMSPWLLRNFSEFGVLLSPGGSRALWILRYDELFIYPASQLTFLRWWKSGLMEILKARVWAAGLNLQSAFAVQAEILLAPLIVIGLWRLRDDLRVRIAVVMWVLTFLAMTLVFPFQGARGGFFHSGAALQPLFWAVAPLGLEHLLELGVKQRGWQIREARRVFTSGLVLLTLFFSIFITYSRVFSSKGSALGWDESFYKYSILEDALKAAGTGSDEIVLVNNSPGYYVASGRSAISIPYGDLQSVCAAAVRYQAKFLLLEIDQIVGGSELFIAPGDQMCLMYDKTIEEVRVYKIIAP
jgi:hypothetical protein